jgi:hypothetical protein
VLLKRIALVKVIAALNPGEQKCTLSSQNGTFVSSLALLAHQDSRFQEDIEMMMIALGR